MLFCGIDVAKHKHAVVLIDEEGQVRQPAVGIENTRKGFDQLRLLLQRQSGAVQVGLEATGHYWLALYEELSQLGYPVVVLNPLQIAAYRKSGVRKVKSDRSGAWWVADFIRIANLPATSQNTPGDPSDAGADPLPLSIGRADRRLQAQDLVYPGSRLSGV